MLMACTRLYHNGPRLGPLLQLMLTLTSTWVRKTGKCFHLTKEHAPHTQSADTHWVTSAPCVLTCFSVTHHIWSPLCLTCDQARQVPGLPRFQVCLMLWGQPITTHATHTNQHAAPQRNQPAFMHNQECPHMDRSAPIHTYQSRPKHGVV